MIPKIIHFIWIGSQPMPALVKKCLASMKETMPSYQLILWDDQASQIVYEKYSYAKQAREHNIYAFASDVIRLYALKHYGGIYLDADLEVFKPLDKFLSHTFFTGFQCDKIAVASIIGSEKNGKFVTEILSKYEDRAFIDKKGKKDFTTINKFIHNMLINEGIELRQEDQFLANGIAVYNKQVFSPYHPKYGGKATADSYTMHHYSGSWVELKRAGKQQQKRYRRHRRAAILLALSSIAAIILLEV